MWHTHKELAKNEKRTLVEIHSSLAIAQKIFARQSDIFTGIIFQGLALSAVTADFLHWINAGHHGDNCFRCVLFTLQCSPEVQCCELQENADM